MPEQTQYGDYLWRGGERIPLDREEAFFTAVVAGPDELTRLSGLPGVREVAAVLPTQTARHRSRVHLKGRARLLSIPARA